MLISVRENYYTKERLTLVPQSTIHFADSDVVFSMPATKHTRGTIYTEGTTLGTQDGLEPPTMLEMDSFDVRRGF